MTGVEELLSASLRERAEGAVHAEALLAGAARRGRRRRAWRRLRAAVAGVAVVALGAGISAYAGSLPGAGPGGPEVAALPVVDGEPTALEDPGVVGAEPSLLHFSADKIIRDARVVRWHSGRGVEALMVDLDSARVAHVDIGPDLPLLDDRAREGELTSTGAVFETTVDGRPATLEHREAGLDEVHSWILRWRPVDGLWARVASYGRTEASVREVAAALRFDGVRRCVVPFHLASLPSGARVLSCELSLGGGSTDASLIIGAEEQSMEVQLQHAPGMGRSSKTANGSAGRWHAFAYPGSDELELLDFPDSYVSARIGKAYAGYTMDDARAVMAGLTLARPEDPATWPERFVG